ncbi:MAG: hypothetical protein CMO80_06665 [Verrucomicrobiales bacterium]|nr:hypothetical protein [Verrucomicrobiales bacterium]
MSISGFTSPHLSYGKKSKDTIYRLADEHSLFYLKWVEGRKGGNGGFLSKTSFPAWKAWSGYALEALAHKHVPQFKRALGIAGLETYHCAWVHRPNRICPQGAQIDLLLDQADNTINIVEIKYSQGDFTITKKYASEGRQKMTTFQVVSGTRKNVFLTFLTTHGITQNAYAS